MSEPAPVMRDVYAAMAELWCSPRDVDGEEARKSAEAAVAELEGIDHEAAGLLAEFLRCRVSEEEYVELFELAPRCSLYLGSHVFDEPQTCAQAAVSDRNAFMIDLQGVCRHFGLTPNGKELSDYLPMVVELLALTAGKDDPIRTKLIKEYVQPVLPSMRARLEELNSPYVHLLGALTRVLEIDGGTRARG
jgi:nitrate reductase molybdenum cofactor assembly chaperone